MTDHSVVSGAAVGRPVGEDTSAALVLVVEDDATLASVVADYLRRAGHRVRYAATGDRALEVVGAERPDLVLLDVMLPDVDGIEVCRRLRRTHPQLPVIMLTALSGVSDRIAGLEVGADDYVTKPFSPRELVLRIDSVLRRSTRAKPAAPRSLVAGTVRLDTERHEATRLGVALNLTVREFELLAFLMGRPGVAFSRETLMREVWGWTFGDQSTVTVHIRRLREKVEDDPARPTLLQTVWGVGYLLQPPAGRDDGSGVAGSVQP